MGGGSHYLSDISNTMSDMVQALPMLFVCAGMLASFGSSMTALDNFSQHLQAVESVEHGDAIGLLGCDVVLHP